MLSNQKSRFYNVPNITEVEITLELCKEIGMEVSWSKEKKNFRCSDKIPKNHHYFTKIFGSK